MKRIATVGARMRNSAALVLAVNAVVIALLGGCAASAPPSVAGSGEVRIETNSPPGLRASQVLDLVNGAAPIGLPDVRALTTTEGADVIWKKLEYLWPDRPFTVTGADYYPRRVTLRLRNAFGASQNLDIRTNDVDLVYSLDARFAEPVITSWTDIDAELRRSGARYSYQVAKVDNGNCEPVAGTNATQALPLASIFKLYVLYAVADAVRTGTLAWDERLTVTERVKAVEFRGLPELALGSTVTVREAAAVMISKSYNTATDLLIDRIGTAAVERALIDAGHGNPQSMTPFPTMYQMFSLGWGVPDRRREWRDAVASGSPLARARLLAAVSATPYEPDPQRSNTPASTYGVEWYGSAGDICRVHAALQSVAAGPAAPVRQIMSQPLSIGLDGEQWPYVGAKGGNLPGDLTFSWYVENRCGQAWAASFQLNWTRGQGMSTWSWIASIAQQAFALAESQPRL